MDAIRVYDLNGSFQLTVMKQVTMCKAKKASGLSEAFKSGQYPHN